MTTSISSTTIEQKLTARLAQTFSNIELVKSQILPFTIDDMADLGFNFHHHTGINTVSPSFSDQTFSIVSLAVGTGSVSYVCMESKNDTSFIVRGKSFNSAVCQITKGANYVTSYDQLIQLYNEEIKETESIPVIDSFNVTEMGANCTEEI